MVFTNAQTTAFFEDANQMAIPALTRLQLQTEGIVTVDDLEEFQEDTLKQIVDNLRRPSGRGFISETQSLNSQRATRYLKDT
jgi:hypothetical protein